LSSTNYKRAPFFPSAMPGRYFRSRRERTTLNPQTARPPAAKMQHSGCRERLFANAAANVLPAFAP
jgi:hypothetical protein